MNKINDTNKKIPLVQLIFNLIVLVIGLIYLNKIIFTLFMLINLILIGTNIIINKYGFLFQAIINTNKFAKRLNNRL